MEMKQIKRIILEIIIFIGSILFLKFVFNINVWQVGLATVLLLFAAWMLAKIIKIPGIPQLISLVGVSFGSAMANWLAESTFATNVSMLYNSLSFDVANWLGVDAIFITEKNSVVITFWLFFVLILAVLAVKGRDHTAMKKWVGNTGQEFKVKNYADKSEMFCRSLRQRLEAINRETDWNENLFTPMEAEIEVCIKDKRKKKYDDLLKCLKSVNYRGAIFLVLGDPGSGKSVSLRKLCLELLDEAKKTKKIPVYINLKKWNKNWSLDNLPSKKDLIDFIKDTLYENGDVLTDTFLDAYFEHMLEDGRWYFVFDSFDEMPCLMGKRNCQELIDKISELLYQFITGSTQTGGIIASRLFKAPSEALGATVTLKIQNFNDIKIKTMLQRYLNNSKEVVKELFGKRENLVVLCRNPFYLNLLINYINEHGLNFPKNQMELYQSFIEKRLKKCSGKLEDENITANEVHEAAKKLAQIMHDSEEYGLECPIRVLDGGTKKEYWRKSIRLLEYARICRYGGQDETVSFVHRRFQEFFFVENIVQRQEGINYEEYKSIMNNSGMRDALVLYCEVAEEQKTREIAEFCWELIKKNISHSNNILKSECIELVNTLYFMAEAFRNRKEVLSGFVDEFEKLINDNLNYKTDFVVQRALTNSMVLFDQTQLQKLVLNVFELKNCWLSDVVMQNCRIIEKLDGIVEMKFASYFASLDWKIFLRQFRNTDFSLSLSKSFRYVRVLHIMIFLIEILTILNCLFFSIYVLFQAYRYIPYVGELYHQFQWKEFIQINVIDNKSFWFESGNVGLPIISILVFILFNFLDIGLMNMKYIRYIPMFSILCYTIILMINKEIINIFIPLIIVSYVLSLVSTVHNICVNIKRKNIVFLKKIKKIGKSTGFTIISVVILFALIEIFTYFRVIVFWLSFIFFLIILVVIVTLGFYNIIRYFERMHWLRSRPKTNCITRETLVQNMKKLDITRCRRIYIEDLIQRKVELVGDWPDSVRPKYHDAIVDLELAKLDCAKLDSSNYLF